MMTPGSRHTTAKSTQRLLLARRVNFLVPIITRPTNHQDIVLFSTGKGKQIEAAVVEY